MSGHCSSLPACGWHSPSTRAKGINKVDVPHDLPGAQAITDPDSWMEQDDLTAKILQIGECFLR
ncbi:hypothetical protein E2C01_089694 [Portunus trituberculatus]|uniref:Uncharacterized protein n=1 Tax=Portunus trituberculatus TaxID=210409 RepID=A0A5B7J9H5_PORTR|nr:hypothetical protein [Portunus trituberculatus]